MIEILALITNWRGEVVEVEETVESFTEFFAKYKFGSFFNSRPEVAKELALPYLSNISPDRELKLEMFEGFTFRSADDVTKIEVVAIC